MSPIAQRSGDEGDWSDEKVAFDSIIAPLAEEAGLSFGYEEGRAFAMESVELTDEELNAVAGGGGGCYIGGGGDSAGACYEEEAGIGACMVMGVGFFSY